MPDPQHVDHDWARNPTDGTLRLRAELRERLGHCRCARDILEQVRLLLDYRAAQTWGRALNKPEATDDLRGQVRGLKAGAQEIETLLRGTDV
jgi:hypothetical protein